MTHVIKSLFWGTLFMAGYLAAMLIYLLCDLLDTIDAWRGQS